MEKDKVINELLSRIANLEYEVERLNNIINKAIEYIEENDIMKVSKEKKQKEVYFVVIKNF